MLDKVPPQNIEAEQSVLGAVLIEQTAIAKISDILTAEDFYREAHRLLYRAAMGLFERGGGLAGLRESERRGAGSKDQSRCHRRDP